MRLNFSNAQPEQIETGIRRLGRVLTEALREAGALEMVAAQVGI
jgi:hypothetical protein